MAGWKALRMAHSWVELLAGKKDLLSASLMVARLAGSMAARKARKSAEQKVDWKVALLAGQLARTKAARLAGSTVGKLAEK